MRYNSEIHHRRSIRLPGYDYSGAGAYFVTICTYKKACFLDDSRLKREVELQWRSVGRYRRGVAMDEFVVMPNHVHGIIWIVGTGGVGAQHTAVRDDSLVPSRPHETKPTVDSACAAPLHAVRPGSLAAIVRAFKSASNKRVNELRGTPGGPVWQRSYWDRIIRSEAELNNVRRYIRDNPRRWDEDPNHRRNQVPVP